MSHTRRYATRQIPLLSKVRVTNDFFLESGMGDEGPWYLNEMIGRTGRVSRINANHECGSRYPDECDPMYLVELDEPLPSPRAWCEAKGFPLDNTHIPDVLLGDKADDPLCRWEFFDEEISVIELHKDSVALTWKSDLTEGLDGVLDKGKINQKS